MPDLLAKLRRIAGQLFAWLSTTIDKTVTWASQLSWWKFLLLMILVLIAGSIVEDLLFEKSGRTVVLMKSDADVRVDSTGIHIGGKGRGSEGDVRIDGTGIHIGGRQGSSDDEDEEDKEISPPAPPAPPVASSESGVPPVPGKDKGAELHLKLPPEIAKEVSSAIREAVENEAEERAEVYRKKSSTWFNSFILLLLLGLFGARVLVGGKKRAEAQAAQASASAERETLHRQVAEAKMQMMQAQVEPHFLFNTLASVEHLIETDPPRAARMQRTLIQYLRAVLPQMRETPVLTSLGRETDMVRSYLDLLKMRMEERLQVEIKIPDGLRSAAFPPMMLQSLVENAIKHGLEGKPAGGTLQLHAEIVHSMLRVTVSDDGLGFGMGNNPGTGLGLQNIRERLKLLHGERGRLIINPNEPSGVRATIEVPYELANR